MIYAMMIVLSMMCITMLQGQQEEPWQMVLDVPVVDFEGLQPWLETSGDTTLVVNFWATWCAPCVQELPHFSQLEKEYGGPLKLVLVSLDFEGATRKKLIPFINRNRLAPEVVHLVDSKMNSWIDKVSPEWSGALPGTLLVRNGDRYFHEGKFKEYSDLKTFINRKL